MDNKNRQKDDQDITVIFMFMKLDAKMNNFNREL